MASVPWSVGLLALDRRSLIIAAFVALMVASVIVSAGAWVLLRRESKARRRDGEGAVASEVERTPETRGTSQ